MVYMNLLILNIFLSCSIIKKTNKKDKLVSKLVTRQPHSYWLKGAVQRQYFPAK